MRAEIWTYIVALVVNWAALIWGTCLIFDVAVLVLRSRQHTAILDWLEQYVREDTRVVVLRTLLVVGLLVAGFNAWDEQYQIALNPFANTLDDLKANEWSPLTRATIDRVGKELSATGPHKYQFVFNDCVDCLVFVSGLRAAFDKAGWTQREGRFPDIGGPPASGWTVNGFDDDQAMNAVHDAIKNNLNAEIPTGRYTAPDGEHFIGIQIGRKPFELQLSQTR